MKGMRLEELQAIQTFFGISVDSGRRSTMGIYENDVGINYICIVYIVSYKMMAHNYIRKEIRCASRYFKKFLCSS